MTALPQAAGDLQRLVWKTQATAFCERCPFRVGGVWPESAGRRARKHTRETGHTTKVRYECTTEYKTP